MPKRITRIDEGYFYVLIRFFIYFIGIAFLTRVSSTLSWLAQILLPFLLWGNNLATGGASTDYAHGRMLLSYALFAITIIATAVFSVYGQHNPFTRFVTIVIIAIVIKISFVDLKDRKAILAMLDGGVLFSLVVSLFLFANYFNGYVFVLDLDEQNWGNRNTAGNVLFFGLCLSLIRCNVSQQKWYFIISTYLLVTIVLSTSLKCITAGTAIYLVYVVFYLFRGAAGITKTIFIIGLFLCSPVIISSVSNLFSSSDDMIAIADRFNILIGHEERASFQYGYMDKRQRLIDQTIKIFFQNPIVGIGLENSRVIYGT